MSAPEPTGGVLCVTLNAALDLTYRAASVRPGEVNRVEHVHAHAGGKGVNVARLLTSWGRPATVLGFAGGTVGEGIGASLDEAGIRHRLVPCAGDSRRTVTVVSTDDGGSTGFYEQGPDLSVDEWDALRHAFEAMLGSARVVVLAGSLPPGVPDDAYRQLTAAARAQGLPVIVDAHGKQLLHALDVGPSVVTPNEAELADALGLDLPVPLDAAVGATRRLLTGGAERAVATLGERGLIGVEAGRAWAVTPPRVHGNPAGAGDAVVAVLADGELTGGLTDDSWPALLHRAAATAAAAVRAPVAGAVDDRDLAELWDHVEVREL
ncbi:MAG TPA: hexose kinase [Motilibacteraceae bacterium]|nr:hexose kinase [Motilibacteraceae bacterium]